MKVFPFFSIIMVSLNAEKFVKKSIESILKQTFTNYEIIVKDGGSTDHTLKLLPDDRRIRVVKKKDNGIYDAMNQAIKYAKGRYLYFLNFGDALYSDTVLEQVYKNLKKSENTKIFLYGNFFRDDIHYSLPHKITDFYLYRTSINHQATFWGKGLLDILGVYNTKYKAAADYDLECRAYFNKSIKCMHIDTTICSYLSGGYSDTETGKRISKEDFKVIHKEYYPGYKILWFNVLQVLSLKGIRRIIDSEFSPLWMRKSYRKFMNIITGR